VARCSDSWLHRHTGLVLWVVPNEAIYRQTLAALGNRDHPYRQILNVAGAGRVKMLEKTAPLARLDVDGHLCVMVLMLAGCRAPDQGDAALLSRPGQCAGLSAARRRPGRALGAAAGGAQPDVYGSWAPRR
jgi:type III restriction enzyme